MKRYFRVEIIKYLFAGGGAVFIDFCVYMLLVNVFGWNHSLSKGTSYVAGAIFAFIVNKYWTFESDVPINRAFFKFTVLYASTFSANVAIHALLMWLWSIDLIAFSIATFASIVLNYIGQKYWVFKEHINDR